MHNRPKELAACGVTTPCSSHMPVSMIWNTTVREMMPYTVGTMIYDQAEADIICHREVRPHGPQSFHFCPHASL